MGLLWYTARSNRPLACPMGLRMDLAYDPKPLLGQSLIGGIKNGEKMSEKVEIIDCRWDSP